MSKLNLFVNWPGWPLFDLKLIKGHQFCINKHKVHSFLHHNSPLIRGRTEFFTLKGLLDEITKAHLLGGYFGSFLGAILANLVFFVLDYSW
jgi:hypothetical protein